jgi:hypothetical protein
MTVSDGYLQRLQRAEAPEKFRSVLTNPSQIKRARSARELAAFEMTPARVDRRYIVCR